MRRPAPLTLLQGTTFVSTLDRFAMPPMLVAIAADLGVPLSQIVHAAGFYFLVYGLCQPLWGFVADRLGRVATMRTALLLAGVSTIVSTLSWSPLSLAIARGAAGGFFGAAYPSSLVYVGDTVPAAVRQRDVARLMVGVAIGTAAASLGAGAVADFATWRIAFGLTGVAALVLVVALRDLPEPTGHTAPPSVRAALTELLRTRMALAVLVFGFADGAVLLGAVTMMPPALEHAGASAALAGAVTAVYGVSVFVAARAVSRLSQRWHPSALIALGGGAATAGCALLATAASAVVGIVVALLMGVAWTSLHSSVQTWATDVLPRARATMMSFFASCMFVGSALAAIAVGGLADAGRYGLLFWLYAVLAALLAVAATVARRRWRADVPTDRGAHVARP